MPRPCHYNVPIVGFLLWRTLVWEGTINKTQFFFGIQCYFHGPLLGGIVVTIKKDGDYDDI